MKSDDMMRGVDEEEEESEHLICGLGGDWKKHMEISCH